MWLEVWREVRCFAAVGAKCWGDGVHTYMHWVVYIYIVAWYEFNLCGFDLLIRGGIFLLVMVKGREEDGELHRP